MDEARWEEMTVTREEHKAVNQAAFIKLKPIIDTTYPPKQFVAIAGGKIVADDPDFEKLREKLLALGIDPMDSLVDRVGEEWSEEMLIL
ncbi:MAG: hypothetical protein L0241_16585 [Planctomycetia bacterium]|nr:hypothetical protein [Planctomycetia bacterium]